MRQKLIFRKLGAICFSFIFFGYLSSSFANIPETKNFEPFVEDLSKPALLLPADPKWTSAPLTLPKGAELTVIEGDLNEPGPFLIRLKLPANYQIPAHWCFNDEHITVISGTLNLGLGDKFDLKKSKALTTGSFARIPAKTHNYSWCSEDTIIQLHGIGPWGIEYLDPKDNPDPNFNSNSISNPDSTDLSISNQQELR